MQRWLLRYELVVWAAFSEMYRLAFGRVDVCRCIENDVWYMVLGAELRGLSLDVPRLELDAAAPAFQHVDRSPRTRGLVRG